MPTVMCRNCSAPWMDHKYADCPQCGMREDGTPGRVVTAPPAPAATAEQAELRAYREAAAREQASITGVKPLVVWYGFWTLLFGFGALSALVSGDVGVFFVAAVLAGLCFLYTRYLFRGGRFRVWFVIF